MITQEYSTLRVLVVDDQEHARRWNSSVLTSLGITSIVEAEDGHAAIRAVSEPGVSFDVIICDLRMPGFDGIETIRAMSGLGLQAGVAITSIEEERVIETAGLLASAQGLRLLGEISKPLTVEKLLPVLQKARDEEPIADASAILLSAEELALGMARRELFLLYQPKVRAASGEYVGAEALVRWNHPDLGVLAPSAFVPVAEQDDALLGELTNYVLNEALAFIARWRDGGRDHSVAVTVPARAFSALDLPDHLARLTKKHKVDNRALTVEVTETQVNDDVIRMLDVATRLRLKSFGLAIDDFGTGQSGLQRLQKTPFTELKIDREFVSGCSASPAKRSIVEASLALARSLGMTSVAEGVSSRPDWDLLTSLRCDVIQGFFIARPMPEHGLEAWATQWMMKY